MCVVEHKIPLCKTGYERFIYPTTHRGSTGDVNMVRNKNTDTNPLPDVVEALEKIFEGDTCPEVGDQVFIPTDDTTLGILGYRGAIVDIDERGVAEIEMHTEVCELREEEAEYTDYVFILDMVKEKKGFFVAPQNKTRNARGELKEKEAV